MSGFLVLWRRELAGYFLSPVAYATLTFFLAVMGTIFYFLTGIMTSGVAGATVMNLMFGSPFYWMTQMIIVPCSPCDSSPRNDAWAPSKPCSPLP